MEIRLDRIGEERFEWTESFSIPLEELNETDLVNLGEVHCRGRIERTSSSGFLLTFDLDYHQTLSCVRCLREIDQEVKAEGQLLLLVGQTSTTSGHAARSASSKSSRPTEKDSPDDEIELSEDDLGVLSLSDPNFDSRPILVEQIHLGIPMKPLCREDCKGLCGSCGSDLNEGPCRCAPKVDPRWSRLADRQDGRH